MFADGVFQFANVSGHDAVAENETPQLRMNWASQDQSRAVAQKYLTSGNILPSFAQRGKLICAIESIIKVFAKMLLP
jgi:hypothetical protein